MTTLADVRRDGNTTKGNKLGNSGFNLRDGGVRSSTGGVMPGVLLEHLSLDSTWCDAVASDTLRATVSGERAAETLVG